MKHLEIIWSLGFKGDLASKQKYIPSKLTFRGLIQSESKSYRILFVLEKLDQEF